MNAWKIEKSSISQWFLHLAAHLPVLQVTAQALIRGRRTVTTVIRFDLRRHGHTSSTSRRMRYMLDGLSSANVSSTTVQAIFPCSGESYCGEPRPAGIRFGRSPDRLGAQAVGAFPEHPLQLDRAAEGMVHRREPRFRGLFGDRVGQSDHRVDRFLEFLSGIGVDPGLIRVRASRPGVNVPAHLAIHSEAWQECGQRHLERFECGDAEKVADEVLADRRGFGGGEIAWRDSECLKILGMERPLDDDGGLRRPGEMHHMIGTEPLGQFQGECPREAIEIMSILNHVVAEALVRERSHTEFPMERHFQNVVKDREVSIPGIATELGHTIFYSRFRKRSHNILPNW